MSYRIYRDSDPWAFYEVFKIEEMNEDEYKFTGIVRNFSMSDQPITTCTKESLNRYLRIPTVKDITDEWNTKQDIKGVIDG